MAAKKAKVHVEARAPPARARARVARAPPVNYAEGSDEGHDSDSMDE